MPGVCGRACYHPCEAGCNRASFDESVSIHSLERFVADAAFGSTQELHPIPNSNPMNVAVAGAGPAGLSCAYFLALLGHEVVIFESRKEAGGVLRWGIPEYRLPKTALKRELQRIFSLPIELRTNATVGKDVSFEELSRFDAAFLSPGAAISSPLSIQGETLERALKGVEFLRRINSKEDIRLGKNVIVIGGGNTAMDVARSALRLGSRVTVAYRRTHNEMPAIPDEITDAEEEGVRFNFLIQPVKIELTKKKKLAVTFQKMKLRSIDAGERPKAVPIKGEFIVLETDNLIAAVGESVDISWLPRKFVKNKLIHNAGLSPKILAGGDATDQPRSIAAAIASGKKAAISIDLLRQGEDMEMLEKFRIPGQDAFSFDAYLKWRISGEQPEAKPALSYEKIRTIFLQPSQRVPLRKLKVEKRIEGFAEINLGYDAKKAVEAANRCFSCGLCNYCDNCTLFCPEGVIILDSENRTRVVDYSHCKGCGTCARSCPRGALIMRDPT
jgi:NADPH-dependent glutamate synthase beta subunit-like oxidoreductase